jgi:UDP-N-acetylglucosamine 2-epimerase (non-hydrolysing)
MVVIGTRPEAIKLAPVARELARRGFDVRVCGTGQHRSLLHQTLRELRLRPHRHLSVMRPNQTLPALSARLLVAMSDLLAEWNPSLVIVQGDTTSTFVGALSAFYRRIPVAHGAPLRAVPGGAEPLAGHAHRPPAFRAHGGGARQPRA